MPEIRDQGLTKEICKKYASELDNVALKIMAPVTYANDFEQWALFDKVRPRIFVTYRNPLESALSDNQLFRRRKEDTSAYFIQITRRLYHWDNYLRRLSYVVRERFPDLRECIEFVGYHEHLDHPQNFVEKVAAHANLRPTAAEVEAALDNVDTSLYRQREEDITGEEREWYTRMPAFQLFEQIRVNPEVIWDLSPKPDLTE